ncbi:hypothetical protein RHMOL_Rhmol05G0086000 [Rhododendron molle]|uniref:Uncharacterized protein n=1 Tax=Rhododendron molle TaxID=49168 RepID=A0ACC0NMS0_RHOML|nr:hypothetical protein RHMOL_Rhmol05G0086000 [Rhododendron molle]
MATTSVNTSIFIFLFVSLHSIYSANAQSFIGVNYGQVADNLPPPSATAKLLQSTAIEKVRLYGADPAMIKALANTGIGIVIGAGNGDIPALASDPNFAGQWVGSNVLAYYPASKIIVVNVASLGGKVKVSTVHSMAVLTQSDPPSSGAFDPSFGDTLKAMLAFQRSTGSPFMINPYPFFAYRSDPRAETLAFCLFQPNAGRVDAGSDQMRSIFSVRLYWLTVLVDAIRAALNAMGFKDIEIVVAETGWPYKGDPNEVGTNIDNARAYNGNLTNHLRSMVGTPLMPGKSVDTYIFALYDEDLKPGPASERAFGLFNPDLSMTYDVGLSKSSQNTTPTPAPTPATPTTPTTPVTPTTPTNPAAPAPKQGGWCVPKSGVSDAQLQANLDYACGQGIDCSFIQPGGACFEPNTVASHAAFAMNLLYQTAGRNPWNCNFSETATLTSSNPSHDACNYPGGGTLSGRLVAQGSGNSSTSGAPLKRLYYVLTFICVIVHNVVSMPQSL